MHVRFYVLRSHSNAPFQCLFFVSLPFDLWYLSFFLFLFLNFVLVTLFERVLVLLSHVYYEQRQGVFFQIHALHALIGLPLIHWQDVNTYTWELAATKLLLQHSIGRRGYSDDAINLCLREFARPSIYMAAPAGRIRLQPSWACRK